MIFARRLMLRRAASIISSPRRWIWRSAAIEESYKSSKPLYENFSPESAPVKRFERLAEFVYESQSQAAFKYGMVCGCPCASLGSEMAGQEAGIRAKFEDITRRFELCYESALGDMVADNTLPKTTGVKVKAQEVYAIFLGNLW